MFFNIYSNQMKSVLASISKCNERETFCWLRCKNASSVRISKGHKEIYSIRFKIEMKLGGSYARYCHKIYAFAAVMVQIINFFLNFQCLLMFINPMLFTIIVERALFQNCHMNHQTFRRTIFLLSKTHHNLVHDCILPQLV